MMAAKGSMSTCTWTVSEVTLPFVSAQSTDSREASSSTATVTVVLAAPGSGPEDAPEPEPASEPDALPEPAVPPPQAASSSVATSSRVTIRKGLRKVHHPLPQRVGIGTASGGPPGGQPSLDRGEDEPVAGEDQDDDHQDRREQHAAVEVGAGQGHQVTQAPVGAEDLGNQRDLPADAVGHAHGREGVGQQHGRDDLAQHPDLRAGEGA